MTWNYRVIRHVWNDEEWLGIHEVFYSDGYDDDNPDLTKLSWTEAAVGLAGDDLNALEWSLNAMKKALSRPILDEREIEKAREEQGK